MVYLFILADMNLVLPYIESFNYSTYHQYVVRVRNRDDLCGVLKKENIGTAIYYPCPLHFQECYSGLGYQRGDFPNSEEASEQVMALPIYPELTWEQQKQVVRVIGGFLTK